MKNFYCLIILLFFQISLTNAQKLPDFENGWWEWVKGSEISEEKLHKVAPHFPHPKDSNFNAKKYDEAIYVWQKLYCFEYERLINTSELAALNPYYNGYIKIIEMPYFIRPLTSYEKPKKQNTGNSVEDELNYQLDIQAWYFVFHPEEFKKIYGADFRLPKWFNEASYRQQIIKKIEESKNTNSLKSSN